MKFIHTADIHLDSSFIRLNDEKKCALRNKEVFNAFKDLFIKAKEEDIKVIVIAGDLFDKDFVNKKVVDEVINLFNEFKDIKVLYALGNHDKRDLFKDYEITNLVLFKNNYFEECVIEDTYFYGINFNESNFNEAINKVNLNKEHKNILIIHGDSSFNKEKGKINLSLLKDKFIDYLALGHIHQKNIVNLDNRGILVYPGCLVSRGYDEIGEKGYFIVDTNDFSKPKFIKSNAKEINELEIDITNFKNEYDLILNLKNKLNHDEIYEITLIGMHNENFVIDTNKLKEDLINSTFDLKIRDKSKLKIDLNKYKNDNSFKGEFIKEVLNSSLCEETKNKILELGTKYFSESEIK